MLYLISVLVSALLLCATPNTALGAVAPRHYPPVSFPLGYEPIRGVSLGQFLKVEIILLAHEWTSGGWLVLEPWVTPSLFDATSKIQITVAGVLSPNVYGCGSWPDNSSIVDEWTFCQYQEYNTAHSALVNHWNTFITEEDIANIAMAGLNHIRIPMFVPFESS